MADIEEIPLEPEAPTEKGDSEIQDNEAENENIAPVAEDIAPKRGRGRPPGAKNKPKAPPPRPPPAPKPKAVRKRKPPPPEYEESSEDSDEGPYRRQQIDHQQVAAEVLGLLSAQRQQRTTARRQRYASWFQNM